MSVLRDQSRGVNDSVWKCLLSVFYCYKIILKLIFYSKAVADSTRSSNY